MDSGRNTLAGGFPHSEIFGSMRICPLPEAFRRLSRLSSPVVAKASTVCACSLDPITRTLVEGVRGGSNRAIQSATPGVSRGTSHFPRAITRALCFAPSILLKNRFAWIPSKPPRPKPRPKTTFELPMNRASAQQRVYLFDGGLPFQDGFGSPFGFLAGWWSQAGSNRRPPACKADALPAELWPHGWWAWVDSNHRPHPYQGCALTT